jgi:probable rRNA maturation factor
MSEINFFPEDIDIPAFLDLKKIEKGLNAIAKNHNSKIEVLNYIFCSDEYIINVNNEYLGHDYYTDIITFPYQQGSIIEGDIFISVDRVLDNATIESVEPLNEFYRVISHGLLHLIGFKDKTDEDQSEMRAEEEKAILVFG